MQSANLWRQLRANQKALLFGLGAGMLWGFLTAATITPPQWLIYDPAAGVIYTYLDGGMSPQVIEAALFLGEFKSNLVQVTLILLVLAGLAGWATWQLSRIQPRGAVQPALRPGVDWYLIGLALGGLGMVWLFQTAGLASWFKGANLTPARWVSVTFDILLPLYMGVALFLVWFRRLASVRAPDWETRLRTPSSPRPTPALWSKFWPGKKGGNSIKD